MLWLKFIADINKEEIISRLGKSQKNALTVLYELKKREVNYILMSNLLNIINASGADLVHRNNFRIAIKRLEEKKFIVRKITKQLTWVVELSHLGIEKAKELHDRSQQTDSIH